MSWYDTFVPIIGPAVGYLVRHILGELNWQKTRKVAQDIIKNTDGAKPITANEAVTQAMTEVRQERIKKEAAKIDSDVPILNGSHDLNVKKTKKWYE